MGISLAEAKALRDEYRRAVSAILKDQSYTIGETTHTKATLSVVQSNLDKYTKIVSRLERGGMRVRRVVFRDD